MDVVLDCGIGTRPDLQREVISADEGDRALVLALVAGPAVYVTTSKEFFVMERLHEKAAAELRRTAYSESYDTAVATFCGSAIVAFSIIGVLPSVLQRQLEPFKAPTGIATGILTGAFMGRKKYCQKSAQIESNMEALLNTQLDDKIVATATVVKDQASGDRLKFQSIERHCEDGTIDPLPDSYFMNLKNGETFRVVFDKPQINSDDGAFKTSRELPAERLKRGSSCA